MAFPASSLDGVLARGDVWRGDTLAGVQAGAVVSSGYPALDAELPGGGWPLGNLVEFLVDRSGFGELGLLLPALVQLLGDDGWLALVAPPWQAHAPAWRLAGLAPERLVVVQPGKQANWCLEQLLACGGFAGVLAWPERGIDARALRRLQVAAEGRPLFTALWRPVAMLQQASPAPLRVALAAAAEGVAVRIVKRRGRPAARPLLLNVPRPGRRKSPVLPQDIRAPRLLPPLQGEGRGGDGGRRAPRGELLPHPPPGLPLEGGGEGAAILPPVLRGGEGTTSHRLPDFSPAGLPLEEGEAHSAPAPLSAVTPDGLQAARSVEAQPSAFTSPLFLIKG